MPRLLPRGLDLVTANARVSLASLVALSVMGPVGAGIVKLAGPPWALRLASVVFVVGGVLAVRLPRRLDDERTAARGAGFADKDRAGKDRGVTSDGPAAGDGRAAGTAREGRAAGSGRGARLLAARAARAETVGPAVVRALRANAAVRAFGGFLLLHLAFLLRADPLHGLPPTGLIASAAAAAGIGSAAGASLGAALRARPPELTVVVSLLAVTLAAGLAWLLYGLVAVLAVAVVAGLTQTLGKLGLDALVQRDVAARVRASAFARSETLLQLSWVAGAGAGTLLPPHGGLGLGLAAIVLTVVSAGVLVAARTGARADRRAAYAPGGASTEPER
jgi:hypothetical protein